MHAKKKKQNNNNNKKKEPYLVTYQPYVNCALQGKRERERDKVWISWRAGGRDRGSPLCQ